MFASPQSSRAAIANRLLATLLLAADMSPSAAEDGGAGTFRMSVGQEVSAGGMVRVQKRDPGLIGGGNGGTGTSINYDDGNLNYGRGFTAIAAQGRIILDGKSETIEVKVEAVYFYDFVNASGDTEFHPLSEEARDRAGRNLYLNEAYAGFRGRISDASIGVRLGNQILRWSDSPSFGYSIAPVNPVSASRRYQPGNTSSDSYVALPMLSAKFESAGKWNLQGFYLFGFEPTETEASGTFLSGNDYYSPGGRYIQLGEGSALVPDRDASVVVPSSRTAQFGSRVPRAGDRVPGSGGQFGARQIGRASCRERV